jgi:hypothetical protein
MPGGNARKQRWHDGASQEIRRWSKKSRWICLVGAAQVGDVSLGLCRLDGDVGLVGLESAWRSMNMPSLYGGYAEGGNRTPELPFV